MVQAVMDINPSVAALKKIARNWEFPQRIGEGMDLKQIVKVLIDFIVRKLR